MSEPTKRQKQFLDFIEEFTEANGYSPSIRDIGEGLKLSSTASVKKMLDRLAESGFIRRASSSARGIELMRKRSIPVIGRIKAGMPVMAEENLEGYISLKDLVRSDSFFLRVEGDSMKNKGILDGDFALLRPSPVIDNGKIGAFRLNGEITLKTFRRNREGMFLVPENDDYPIIPVHDGDDFEVIGILDMVLRFFKGNYDIKYS
ncbi:transcriptional repressor LexA [Geovibrio ferrireducens]|uniref:transcriptional repressor LexA n=1 Tax=Geovibrio ferrireducens TaxID=46201 RepID=UPI002246C401|nr:transcriptional repressor LexA [Geovibrio ferrireducens]